MAAERIGYNDIFDPKAIPTAIDEVKRLQKELEEVSDTLKNMVKASNEVAKSQEKGFDNAERIRATEKAINDTVNAAKELGEVEKSRLSLEAKMAKLLGARATLIEDLEVKVSELKEAQKKLKKEEKDGIKTAEQATRERAKLQTQILLTKKAINEERKALIESTKEQAKNTTSASKSEKIKAQLKQLTSEAAKEEALLAEELRKQRKALRDNAKEALANRDAFQQLTKETNDAQKRFKKLAAEFGATSKQAQEAHKEFIRLDDQLREINDAAKDGRRDVGRYRIAVTKLNGVLSKIGTATGVVAVLSKLFEGFSNVLGNNSEAGAGVEKILGTITVTFTVLLGRLTKGLPTFAKLFMSVFEDVSNSIERFVLKAEISFASFTSVLGSNDDKIAELEARLKVLDETGSNTANTWDDLTKVFEGTGDEIANTIEKNNNLIDTTLAYRKAIISLQKQINSQLSAQAKLQAAADNENNSLEDRIEAQEKLITKTEEIQDLEVQIAQKREQLAVKNAGIFKDSLDAQEEAAAATSERIALEIEQEEERLAQKTELQTLEADLLEQRLDFLIDNFDNQKTINERIIADETTTFEERNRLLEENKRLADESYDAQLEAFNKRLEEQGKAQLDFESLVNESDSRLIAQQALNAGLSERLTTRLLEVIRERRTVTQDNAEAQKDLNDANFEALKIEEETATNLETVNKLKEDGVDVEKVLQNLEEKRLEQTIENLRFQIALFDEGSAKRIKLEKDLSDALLEEQQMRLDKEAEAEEKAAQRRVEVQEAAATTIERFAEKMHEKRLSRIEDQLEAEQKRADELRELAQRGIQDAENNLAENQKRQAELERQREKELKRQKNFELALAAARAYSANVAAGEKNPLAKTITDVTLLEAFVESLTGFYHGTEDTGNSGLISDEHGVITGYTHANERVMTAEQNAMLPSSLPNWELVRLANLGKQGDAVNTREEVLVNGLRDVKNAIEKKPSYLGRDYSSTEKAIIDTYHERGKITRKHYKRSGLISRKK